MASSNPEVIGVGVIVRDLTVVVERAPRVDEKVSARTFCESGGGPVPTALVALARWGRSVALGGVVGTDRSAGLVLDELSAEGVTSTAVCQEAGFETPVSVITVEPPHRSICEVGQVPRRAPGALVERLRSSLEGCRLLLVDGRLPEAQRELAEAVRGSGGRVLLDAGRPREGLDRLLGAVDYAFVSSSFCGHERWPRDVREMLPTLRATLAADGPRVAGVTLGPAGCVYQDDRGPAHVPGYAVDVLDSTGAGDIFHAGLAEALLSDEDLAQAVRFGCAAAALSCRGLTGRAALPPPAEIRRFAVEAPVNADRF